METCSWQPSHLDGKHFQLWIYHEFLIHSQFSSALYSSPVVYTATYIFLHSHVLTRVTAIKQYYSFQITDKTTNSLEEQSIVTQGKLKNPLAFYYVHLTYFVWGFCAIKHRGNGAANTSDPQASIRNGLLQKVYSTASI